MVNGTEDETTSVEGITSLLDTDLYKLTMQCAVLEGYPDVGLYSSLPRVCGAQKLTINLGTEVTYAYTNRTPDLKLSRAAFEWLQHQVSGRNLPPSYRVEVVPMYFAEFEGY